MTIGEVTEENKTWGRKVNAMEKGGRRDIQREVKPRKGMTNEGKRDGLGSEVAPLPLK